MRRKIYDIVGMIEDYTQNGMGLEPICAKYHIGKVKLKEMFGVHGIQLRKKGKQPLEDDFVVKDWKTEKYPDESGYEYIAVDKNTEFETRDYLNRAGVLTSYIRKQYGVKVPSLYERRLYYMRTGNYWWEQWFTIAKRKKADVKVCPICGWETIDVGNVGGYFSTHLKNAHNITVEQYLQKFPEDEYYFPAYVARKNKEKKLKNQENYTTCPICGKKYEKITESHVLHKHNITLDEFKKQYPTTPIMSIGAKEQIQRVGKYSNMFVSKKRFVSTYEKELQDFMERNGVEIEANRQMLDGKEIDILIPSKKIGIEFDGLLYHSEFFGKKSHTYHLDKTRACNNHGYGLIHIFEDEYVNHKDIVYNKLSHILGLDNGRFQKLGARKCTVRRIYKHNASEFLDKNHIQGFVPSTYYYGAFFNDELVGVMSFKYKNLDKGEWELTRYATSPNYIYQGLASKIFSHFVKDANPNTVISFADRRWTVKPEDNLYTKLGFSLDGTVPPDYRYYNSSMDKYKRLHKMGFRKEKLIKKYGFPKTMTEIEMARELGYDRIWDCGLFKYVWHNNRQ